MAELTKEFLIDKYWGEGKSLNSIAKELYLPSHGAVTHTMRKFNIPRRTLLEAMSLTQPPNLKRPNLQTDANLAYILGVHLGDGCTSVQANKSRYEWVVKGEQGFVNNIAQVLQSIGLYPYIRRDNGCFRVTTASRIFVQWLKQLSLQDIEELLTAQEFKVAFIEGFYDAEGNLEITPRRNRTFPHVVVRIGNTNLPLLEMCQRLLRDLSIYSRVSLSNPPKPPRRAYYHLTIPSYYWSQKFLNKIESCVFHKSLAKLNEALADYPAPRIRPKKRTLREVGS